MRAGGRRGRCGGVVVIRRRAVWSASGGLAEELLGLGDSPWFLVTSIADQMGWLLWKAD